MTVANQTRLYRMRLLEWKIAYVTRQNSQNPEKIEVNTFFLFAIYSLISN